MKNLRYILTVLVLLLLNSCEKFIDLQPLNQISSNDYWKTTSDLKNYMLQFYPVSFPNSEMVSQTAGNSDDMLNLSPSAIMNGERVKATGNWKNDWVNIRNINIFFSNYQKCTDLLSTYSQYLGEAYFFRAWFYFNLVKTYGDVPWYSKPIEIDSETELMRPRDPRTLVVDSILANLDKAVLYLGNKATTGNNRINKEAALAFKTRVALNEGTWQKYHASDVFGTSGANPTKYFQACISAAEELMSGSYSVGIYNTGNPDKDYYQLFGFDNMNSINEVLLYKSFNAAEGYGNMAQNYLTGEPNSKGATWELVSSYLGKNGLPYDYSGLAATTKGNAFLTKIATDCDPRLSATVFIPGDLIAQDLSKYFIIPPIDKGGTLLCPTGFMVKKSTNPNTINSGRSYGVLGNTGFIILRYGEVLLNYAEAKYELDNTVAYTQLNLLRRRAGMPDFAVIPQSSDLNPVTYGYAVTDALYEIRRERRVEMALEGYRDEDYMRWAAASIFIGKRSKGYPYSAAEFPAFTPKLDANGLIDYYQTMLPNGYQFRTGQDYLNSIPQDEITINPNLTQNPGW
ncbi:MAG: RagB/SusD family nutrient uptake outer membrane protein [Bacteroidetes bacterium]|nr:MAG: RagB/SusD family nutrient uptake outer membrane protein [Bacteroidota bacterium]